MSRILIIEDDMDLQEGLTYFLEKEGYEILTAGTKKSGDGDPAQRTVRSGPAGLQPAGRERVRHLCRVTGVRGYSDPDADGTGYGDGRGEGAGDGRRGLYVQALFHRCAQSTDPEDPSGQETGEPACLRRDRAGERFMQSVQKRRRDPVQQG